MPELLFPTTNDNTYECVPDHRNIVPDETSEKLGIMELELLELIAKEKLLAGDADEMDNDLYASVPDPFTLPISSSSKADDIPEISSSSDETQSFLHEDKSPSSSIGQSIMDDQKEIADSNDHPMVNNMDNSYEAPMENSSTVPKGGEELATISIPVAVHKAVPNHHRISEVTDDGGYLVPQELKGEMFDNASEEKNTSGETDVSGSIGSSTDCTGAYLLHKSGQTSDTKRISYLSHPCDRDIGEQIEHTYFDLEDMRPSKQHALEISDAGTVPTAVPTSLEDISTGSCTSTVDDDTASTDSSELHHAYLDSRELRTNYEAQKEYEVIEDSSKVPGEEKKIACAEVSKLQHTYLDSQELRHNDNEQKECGVIDDASHPTKCQDGSATHPDGKTKRTTTIDSSGLQHTYLDSRELRHSEQAHKESKVIADSSPANECQDGSAFHARSEVKATTTTDSSELQHTYLESSDLWGNHHAHKDYEVIEDSRRTRAYEDDTIPSSHGLENQEEEDGRNLDEYGYIVFDETKM